MQQSDRERFEALIAAKKKKSGGGKSGHDDDHKVDHARNAQVKQTFSRRKV